MTTGQLRSCGLSSDGIRRWFRAGRLHRVFHGVYLVGHSEPAPLALEQGALLAVGPDSVLSHHTAARRYDIAAGAAVLHVTTPHRARRSRPGIVVHHADLAADQIRRRDGLRMTSPARTLADLAPFLARPTLERATNEAQVLGLVRPEDLADGPPALRALTNDRGFTRQEAERQLRGLLRRAGLEPTRTNVTVEGHEVDALYADERLIVEVDGYATHRSRGAFERDHRRDLVHAAAGYHTLRITWRQLVDTPEAVVAHLAAALVRRAPA